MSSFARQTFSIAALAAVIGLVAGLGVRPHASAQGPAVSVTSVSAQVDALANVEVWALDIGPPGLAAWTVNVHYDPTKITVLTCTPLQNGFCNTDYAAGTVRVVGSTDNGLQGDVVLASIGLICTQGGSSNLTPEAEVFADATVGDPQPINATMLQGAVTCTQNSGGPTPTPTQGSQPTPTPPATEPKLPGDADCNGVVNSIDAALILQYDAGLISSVPCPDDANFNHDGSINAIDAALVLQTEAGLI